MQYRKKFQQLKEKDQKALIPFTVVGDPDPETSLEIIKTMTDSGADILELGFPFSDPIADGPIIQSADIRSLSSNTTPDKAFEIISKVRKHTDIPIGILVYYNIIYQRGIEQFYKDASAAGINSILIADMPIEEAKEIIAISKKESIDTVFIVSPLTSNERLKQIAESTTGFIYVVARLGVTGAQKDLKDTTIDLLKRIRPLTDHPLCVGFGISTPEHVKKVCNSGADGAIVGSAIVKIIEKHSKNKKKLLKEISDFIKTLKSATL